MARLLPDNPNFDQLKHQAKDLIKSHQNGDLTVCDILRHLKRCADLTDSEILSSHLNLHEAQFALALDYGFSSWNALKKHVQGKQIPLSFVNWAEDARLAVYNAQEDVKKSGGTLVDINHLYYAIARLKDTPGARLIQGLQSVQPFNKDNFVLTPEDNGNVSSMTLSTRAKKSIDYTYDEVRMIHGEYVGTQHLVTGIIRVLTEMSDNSQDWEKRFTFCRHLLRYMPEDTRQTLYVKQNVKQLHEKLDKAKGNAVYAFLMYFIEYMREHDAPEMSVALKNDGILTVSILKRHDQSEEFNLPFGTDHIDTLLKEITKILGLLNDYLSIEKLDGDMKRLKIVDGRVDNCEVELLLKARIVSDD